MNGSVVGKRYAKALINLAGSDKNIEKTGKELQEVATMFSENVELQNAILEPNLNRSMKVSVVEAILKKMKISALVNRFCRYLTDKNRFSMISDISSAYDEIASDRLGKATAQVVVAQKLTSKEEKKLQQQLSQFTGKNVSLSITVDDSILGGAITTIGSQVLDGSIRNKLNLIRETIVKGN